MAQSPLRKIRRAGRSSTKRNGRAKRTLFEAPVSHEAEVRVPEHPVQVAPHHERFEVATYNVHRWAGGAGSRRWSPDRATEVIAELEAPVIALQEVLRPEGRPDPLTRLADNLGLHLAYVPIRRHRQGGEIGNAILSRWPVDEAYTIDLSFSRLERRAAIAVQFDGSAPVAVVATHLALIDRTRKQQVRSLLDHPALQGAVVLLGDMNAWRRCKATRDLDEAFLTRHHNRDWPPTFPATRPMLALDRAYARHARLVELRTHDTPAARRASDHLPLVATVKLEDTL